MKLRYTMILLLCYLFLLHLFWRINTLYIISYNVQNFFDDIYSGTEYAEFMPSKWNTHSAHTKSNRIAQVIEDSAPFGSDIIALQEIENKNALSLLLDDLRFLRYHFVTITNATSTTQVALISRFPILTTFEHAPQPQLYNRNILEAHVLWHNQRIIIFVNHWKSQRNENVLAQQQWHHASTLLQNRTHELYARYGNDLPIIILGDFNTAAHPVKASISSPHITPHAQLSSLPIYYDEEPRYTHTNKQYDIYNHYWYTRQSQIGTYRYQDNWTQLDHILYNNALRTGQLHVQDIRIMHMSHLVQVIQNKQISDPTASIFINRFNQNSLSGYSDHLPIQMRIIHYY